MNVIIIEDEAIAAERLINKVKQILPETVLLGVSDSITGAIQLIQKSPAIDLIFMDIHLADGLSFEIMDHIEINHPIIFTTAYDEYAMKAFDLNAVHYLLKPIKDQDLEKALSKFERIKKSQSAYLPKLKKQWIPNKYKKRFLVKLGSKLHIIESDEVAYFLTSDKITFIMTAEGKRYPIDFTLDKLEEVVDPNVFFRLNRQYLVSQSGIDNMHIYSKARVRITLSPPQEEPAIVSSIKSSQFKQWLLEH